jgi:hypothetical protein
MKNLKKYLCNFRLGFEALATLCIVGVLLSLTSGQSLFIMYGLVFFSIMTTAAVLFRALELTYLSSKNIKEKKTPIIWAGDVLIIVYLLIMLWLYATGLFPYLVDVIFA